MMNDIERYNQARKNIDLLFFGLPHAHKVLVNALIIRANPKSGLVENITYRDLTDFLTVNSAPGRKDSGTPQKQTIRSYLRTIESQCGDHFQIISDSQALKIKFPTLPAIYASHFEYTAEAYTDPNTVPCIVEHPVNAEENTSFTGELNAEQYTEMYTDKYTSELVGAINVHEHTCAKIKPNYKTNKQQTNANTAFSTLKQPISPEFYPTQEAIDLALTQGFAKVTSDIEIKKFILYNQASATRWADYNPVFLEWLKRDKELEKQQEQKKQTHSFKSNLRINSNERISSQSNNRQSIIADAIARNQRIIDEEQRQAGDFIEGQHINTLDCIDWAV